MGLNNFPANIYGDEIVLGRVAINSYLTGPRQWIFSLLWNTVDLPGLWFLTVATSLDFGNSALWSLRLPSALFGALTALPFYGFMRISWGRAAAITGTSMLAFSAVEIHYSRVALNNIVTAFFWAACFFFLMRGLRSPIRSTGPWRVSRVD